MSTRDDYAGLSDTVLYDVFYEAGTMVGGALVASWRRAEAAGDQVAAQQFRDEHFSVNHERNAVAARDREGQIAWILRWEPAVRSFGGPPTAMTPGPPVTD